MVNQRREHLTTLASIITLLSGCASIRNTKQKLPDVTINNITDDTVSGDIAIIEQRSDETISSEFFTLEPRNTEAGDNPGSTVSYSNPVKNAGIHIIEVKSSDNMMSDYEWDAPELNGGHHDDYGLEIHIRPEKIIFNEVEAAE